MMCRRFSNVNTENKKIYLMLEKAGNDAGCTWET